MMASAYPNTTMEPLQKAPNPKPPALNPKPHTKEPSLGIPLDPKAREPSRDPNTPPGPPEAEMLILQPQNSQNYRVSIVRFIVF